jgi:cytochrome c2
MPSSLLFILSLLGLAALCAPVSVAVILHQGNSAARVNAEAMTGGSAARGRRTALRYGCNGCHALSRTAAAAGMVGPPLTDIAARAEIAGKFPNTPERMTAWLRFPQEMAPGCGMPDQGISDAEARDIAAYLYTLRPLSG